jgi:hypothetical protein
MKSELDLVREFSELNETKVDSWGRLPPSSEKRFRELKAYFEDLMRRRSADRIPLLDRYETFEIRTAVPMRSRLRIPAEMSLFFCHQDAYAPARAVNLSRGGLFLGSDITFEPGARMTLYMPNLGRGYETLFETMVGVIWEARERRELQRGMGVHFEELRPEAEEQLDDFIVAFLRDRISKSSPVGHRPGWLAERRIIV